MSESEPDANESSAVECPTCDEEFDLSRYMKSHHKQVHGEGLVDDSYDESGELDCPRPHCDYTTDSEKSLKGHHNSLHGGPAYPNPVDCDYCDQTFHKPRWNEYSLTFCDNECKRLYQQSNRGGKSSPRWVERVEIDCQWCGTTLKRQECNLTEERRTFCRDKNCLSKWFSQFHTLPESEKKDTYSYSYAGKWPVQRRKALERDDFECQSCGVDSEHHISEYGMNLDVHHIERYQSFDDPYEANRLTNLLTLCKGCHNKYEGLSKEQIVS